MEKPPVFKGPPCERCGGTTEPVETLKDAFLYDYYSCTKCKHLMTR